MTIFGASDALGSLGIDWEQVCSKVAPDQISVYAGSAMGRELIYERSRVQVQADIDKLNPALRKSR